MMKVPTTPIFFLKKTFYNICKHTVVHLLIEYTPNSSEVKVNIDF